MGKLLRMLSDVKYWVLNRTTRRFHIVKTGLKPGYHDTDTRMLYACFSLLSDFVELERGGVKGIKENIAAFEVELADDTVEWSKVGLAEGI